MTIIILANWSIAMTTRQEYIATFKQQLDDMNNSISECEARAQKPESDSKILWQDSLFKLRQQFNLTH